MKRLICTVLSLCMLLSLAACGGKTVEADAAGFKPALDVNTACSITVAGSYDNFEALEAEFDRFNRFYPNVQLNYVKLDDFNNTLVTVLGGNDSPNIFFSHAWMIGNAQYDPVFALAEDLSDPALGLDLACIRPGLIDRDAEGRVPMVPVFSRNYGMLVNNDLFKKEGLSVPTTWTELLAVCDEFRGRGFASPVMGYSLDPSATFMNAAAYPLFLATLAGNPEAIAAANALDPAAGEYMRPALEAVERLIDSGCVDLAACDGIGDNYSKVILRFFEGDVPMMFCTGDTVSGTAKRERQSEAFSAAPFAYSFAPIPLTEEGGYFVDSPSLQFSVNKNCGDLAMTNEFMRFLITKEELNEMASVKRMLTPTVDLSFDAVYAPFGQVPPERIISPELLGVQDPLTVQMRLASFSVGRGEMSVDEAVAAYGSFS